MTIAARQLHPLFFGEITGVDFARPPDADTIRQIVGFSDHYGVVAFPETGLDDHRHVAWSRMLGPLEQAPRFLGSPSAERRLKLPELFEAGNIDAHGKITGADNRGRMFARGNKLWHTDSSFNPTLSKYSLLLAYVVPPDHADTEFADMRAAYDALPQTTKAEIENLVVVHDMWRSRQLAGFPDVTEEQRREKPPSRHHLVHTHPGSKRKALFMGAHASHIEGRPIEEGRRLLRELMEFATQGRFVHRYRWKVGDLVMWDNRVSLHRATPFDDFAHKRDMRRTTVIDAAA
jgi:alpha-ketoglutarate-dependent 2,4-dichlorophenoxyacetate dioxygenase